MKPAELSFLVVEDHAFQRETLVDVLKAMQAKSVHSASDGRKALDLLLKLDAPIDVIVCDLEMPTMDGLELMRRVGESGYSCSVIIVSGLEHALLSSSATMAQAYGVNLLGTIGKPVTRATLEAVLMRHASGAPKPHVQSANGPSFTLAEIMRGLERNEFEPFFQPKVEFATRRVVGAEVLARWRHPQQGIVPPVAFVKVLEDAGKIDELTWVMLRKGVAFCSALKTAGIQSSVAVNLSLKSLNNVELANRVTEVLRAHNFEPWRTCLEITETAATTNLGAALENLTRLRMKGFGLSIDDFGTGYSSIQQLTRIPFTELKIDRSFVTNSGVSEAAKVILRSSLRMARELNIKAVAEGVETQQDWDLLQELGCDLAQGYFIAKPMEGDAYVNWLRALETSSSSMFVAA